MMELQREMKLSSVGKKLRDTEGHSLLLQAWARCPLIQERGKKPHKVKPAEWFMIWWENNKDPTTLMKSNNHLNVHLHKRKEDNLGIQLYLLRGSVATYQCPGPGRATLCSSQMQNLSWGLPTLKSFVVEHCLVQCRSNCTHTNVFLLVWFTSVWEQK